MLCRCSGFRTASWSFRENGGEIVEYAVLMKRLPEELMMDRLLAEDDVSIEQTQEVARIVARFHQQAEPTAEVQEAGSPANQRTAILDNFNVAKEVFDPGLHDAVEKRARSDADALLAQLSKRAARGLVVDGHGDLHSRNICLTNPPAIFDCIEFSPKLRCGDVAVENAFLMMDLIYRGHRELACAYLDTYIAESGDEEQRRLMPAFVSYRAMVRAKVAALTASDPNVCETERAHASESAARHLQFSAAAALNGQPLLIITCGLPGTGKSYICQALAERSAWPLIVSDVVRKELAGFDAKDRLPAEFYRPEFSTRTYGEVIRRACEELPQTCVVVDANFPTAEIRALAATAAEDAHARPAIVWVTAPEPVVLKRIAARSKDKSTISDADVTDYEKLKTAFEPPSGSEGLPIVEVDGAGRLEANLNHILTALHQLR